MLKSFNAGLTGAWPEKSWPTFERKQDSQDLSGPYVFLKASIGEKSINRKSHSSQLSLDCACTLKISWTR